MGIEGAALLMVLTNVLRCQNGVAPLAADPRLMAIADMRAQQATTNFSHYDANGQLIIVGLLPGLTVGENLAAAHDAQEAEAELEGSPPHRANLLDSRFGRMGAGEACTPSWCYYAEVLAHGELDDGLDGAGCG